MSAQKKLYQISNNDPTIAYPNNRFQVGATIVNVNNGQVVAMQGGRKPRLHSDLTERFKPDGHPDQPQSRSWITALRFSTLNTLLTNL